MISGEAVAGYNGTFTITGITSSTITFTDSATGLASCSTASWRDAQMDPDLSADVQGKCGSRVSVSVKP